MRLSSFELSIGVSILAHTVALSAFWLCARGSVAPPAITTSGQDCVIELSMSPEEEITKSAAEPSNDLPGAPVSNEIRPSDTAQNGGASLGLEPDLSETLASAGAPPVVEPKFVLKNGVIAVPAPQEDPSPKKPSGVAASNVETLTKQGGIAIEPQGPSPNQDTVSTSKPHLENGPGQLFGAPAGYLVSPKPAYPREARKRNQEGVVLLSILVSERGLPVDIELSHGSGFCLLDEAAVAAVKKWRFNPARRGKMRVPSHIEVPIVFKLWAQPN